MNPITNRWRAAMLLGIVLLVPSYAAAKDFKKTFPRIGAYEIGSGKKIVDPEYRERLAKNDILILGFWRRWSFPDSETGESLTIRDVVIDIRNRAERQGNRDIWIAKYTAINESSSNPDNNATRERWEKLHSETGPGLPVNNDWWARTRNGEHTSSWEGQWHVNMTEFVRRDKDGYTYPEWAATEDYNVFFKDTPEFDMWYIDNWFYRPRVEPDWDGDGKNDDRNNETVRRYFRKGYVNALNRIRELAPNLVVMGNVDGAVDSGNGMLTEPEYKGKITALFEGAIGLDYSVEGWGGWDAMMQQYRTTIGNAQHNLLLMTAHGRDDDYATMRYGLTSTLMDNGYYYYTSLDQEYRSALWFDEYDVDLGRAIDPPQFSPWQNGVYMRRFEKGLALVNPKGNGKRTVTVPSGYKRIRGSQDPAVNNGNAASSVTLAERDGLILVRTDQDAETERPKPPVMLME